jgi:carbamoyl-phosphate synthase large subunit
MMETGKMKNIVVLGGSYLQSDFIETAVKICNNVYVLDRDKTCYARTMDHITFAGIDISSVEEVESYFLEKKCDLIVSPVTEIGNRVAARIADRNGLPYNSLDAVKATTDKWVMRNQLRNSGLKEPESERFSSPEQVKKNFKFPLIVKPPVSSASRGVSLVENEAGLNNALDEALKFTDDKTEILIEEYIEGDQYSIETISSRGEHYVVGITREFISGAPYFVERTDLVSIDDTNKLYNKLQGYIEQLLDGLGITTGPCHVEVKIREGEIYLIEAASRSGLMRARLLKKAECSDYNELIIRAYSGEKIVPDDIQKPGTNALLGVVMTRGDMDMYHKAKQNGLLVDEYFNGKEPVEEPRRLTDAFGYFFITGGNEILNYKLT